MKKLLIIALAIMAGAYSVNATAGGKKDKKQKKQAVEEKAPVNLLNSIDSVSYALGVETTNGLIPYLVQQMNVDTTYMTDFIRGFEDTMDKVRKNSLTAYGAGINVANMVEQRMIPNAKNSLKGVADSINNEIFFRGFIDAIKKDTTVLSMKAAETYMNDAKERQVQAQKAAGAAFLKENSQKPGVITLPSGLQYRVLREGNGPVATTDDEVVVKYEGRLIDGTVFDSSYTRKEQTNKFKPTQVIKGWTEALTLMPQGSMWELYIPENLAYGNRQAGQIPPYSTLIFKVELEEVVKAQASDENVNTVKTDDAKTVKADPNKKNTTVSNANKRPLKRTK